MGGPRGRRWSGSLIVAGCTGCESGPVSTSIDVPELSRIVAVTVREWLEEVSEDGEASLEDLIEPGGERLSERNEGLIRLAIERAWLREQDDDEEDVDLDPDEIEPEPEPELADSTAAMARLATDPSTPVEIADDAGMWVETCTYGLWQLSNPRPRPGVWLTDIVSGVRRYAAISPQQLAGAGRWSVLMGPLVAIDGVWRTTGAVVPLRPSEADGAAELVQGAANDLVRVLSGKRTRRKRGRGRGAVPHGVLVEAAEKAGSGFANLIGKVVGSLLPVITGELWRRRAAGPRLHNTDGHPLKFITAQVNVEDPTAAAERLAAHPDVRFEDDEGLFTWWGRELTAMEQQSALAEMRARFGEDEPVEDADETPRWLRGRLKPANGGFEVEVNSEQRLAMLLELLDEFALAPSVTHRSATDPALDLPPIPTGGPMPCGASQDAIDAWLEHWSGERVPALGQLTPRAASRRKDKRPYLEAVLREFEHDAFLLERDGKPAPDIGRLRAELGMECWYAPAGALSG